MSNLFFILAQEVNIYVNYLIMKKLILFIALALSVTLCAQSPGGVFYKYSYATIVNGKVQKWSSKYAINTVVHTDPVKMEITLINSKVTDYKFTAPAVIGTLEKGNRTYYEYSCKDKNNKAVRVIFVFYPGTRKVTYVMNITSSIARLYE